MRVRAEGGELGARRGGGAPTLTHPPPTRTHNDAGLANVAFPAALLGYAHGLAGGVLTLKAASQLLLLTCGATLAGGSGGGGRGGGAGGPSCPLLLLGEHP